MAAGRRHDPGRVRPRAGLVRRLHVPARGHPDSIALLGTPRPSRGTGSDRARIRAVRNGAHRRRHDMDPGGRRPACGIFRARHLPARARVRRAARLDHVPARRRVRRSAGRRMRRRAPVGEPDVPLSGRAAHERRAGRRMLARRARAGAARDIQLRRVRRRDHLARHSDQAKSRASRGVDRGGRHRQRRSAAHGACSRLCRRAGAGPCPARMDPERALRVAHGLGLRDRCRMHSRGSTSRRTSRDTHGG